MNMQKFFLELDNWSLHRVFLRKSYFYWINTRLVKSSFLSMHPYHPQIDSHNIIRLTHDYLQVWLGLQVLKLTFDSLVSELHKSLIKELFYLFFDRNEKRFTLMQIRQINLIQKNIFVLFFSGKMNQQLHEMIHQARLKCKVETSHTTHRNLLNETYQEHEFYNMKYSFDRLMENFQHLAKQTGINQKCFAKILQNPKAYSSSLLSQCKNLLQLLQSQSKIRLSHQYYSSQSILLALFIKFCYPKKYVAIVTTKPSLKQWQKILIDEKVADSQSELKSLLEKTNITVHLIENSYNQSITHTDQFLILDFMNAQVVEYKPLVLSLKQSLSVPQKIIVYHSHIQQLEVSKVLSSLDIDFFEVQSALSYPIQIEYIQKDAEIKDRLVQFLKQEQNHPQKQDVIIFYKNQHLSNSTPKRFIQKVNQPLRQHHLESHIQFVTQKNQNLTSGKNHIFIVQNFDQLLDWNYSYEEVFLVIDYGWNSFFRMDHQINCYVQGSNRNDILQKAKRVSILGVHKVGKYIYNHQQFNQLVDYLERPRQLNSYILRMIDLGFGSNLQEDNPRVKICIQKLIENQIISRNSEVLTIVNEDSMNYIQQGIDPLQAKIIKKCLQHQKEKEQKTISNLILMAFCILNTKGNLRQVKDKVNTKSSKPSQIWRKSGYLESSIQILTKAEIIEQGKNTKKSVSKKSQSKVENPDQAPQLDFMFDGLFQAYVPKKIQFEDMSMNHLLREYFVNSKTFAQIRSKVDELREVFNIEQTLIKIDNDLLNETIQILSSYSQYVLFSGSRRKGYYYKNTKLSRNSIYPHKESLMGLLNQYPQFIFVMRCIQQDGKQEIFMSNSINPDTFMAIFGSLPCRKSESLAENQIQFHGISSSIFKGLFRNNGMQMKKFQEENKCFIEPNQQMATITVYSAKAQAERVKTAFQELIAKIKQKFINYNKIVHYAGNTNISMSNGGQVKEIIKDNYINRCYLNNLDLQVTHQDLDQLFDEFFVLKNIEILPPEIGKFSKSAIIQFNSQKDFYRFFSYYNECKYFQRLLEVKPIMMKQSKTVDSQMFIDFKWYVWKSHKKAIVIFKTQQTAQKAFKALTQQPKLDEHPITFALDKKKILLDNLNQTVDQIFLQKAFLVYGEIQMVQILKTPLKQPSNQQNMLDFLIRKELGLDQNDDAHGKYRIQKVEKHKNGLRICRVGITKIQNLNILIGKLNNVKGILGEGRLYAQSMFTKPIPILYPSIIHLYETFFEQTLSKQAVRPNIRYYIRDYGEKRTYMVLQTPLHATLNYISAEFQKRLRPQEIPLTTLQKTIIVSDVGIDNLIDLEEKFNCKLITNSLKKTLEVICTVADFYKINEQVNLRIKDNFFYRIFLNNRSYKNLASDTFRLQEIKKKYFLNKLDLEEYSKTLIFQGNANHIQNALNYMMHLIQSFSKSEQEMINTEACLICCQDLNRPYRLQNCGHKFCFNCLLQCINSALGDMSMFPIKCPHCMIQLTIDDLESLIDPPSWNKVINMGVNQFVGKNSDIMTFCYSPGCKQINMLKLKNFKCDLCNVNYCSECKQNWHEGLTCQEAKNNTDALFKKYMQQNGVRVCPNQSCKMPIVRTDGCFRVTCSRCNKSMCFKCEPEKMIAYDNYNDCYKHLTDVHGGYW